MMSRITVGRRTILSVIVMCMLIVCLTGCDCSQKVALLQEQNQALTQRVAELEDQLAKADVDAASGADEAVKAPAGGAVYTVKFGDSLWSIARDQLGSGSRFEEITALNPGVTEDLAVGSKLKMPAR